MQPFLLAAFVSFAAAALPNKATLKSIFIDGTGTKAPNFLTQAQVDSIDRELMIKFQQPAFKMDSSMPQPFNDTCGLSDLSCPAQTFDVMPGMDTSTIAVRGLAITSANGHMDSVGPTITFTMNAGKKYTFLMADAWSGASFWAQGFLTPVKQAYHYSVLNMDESSGLPAALKADYAAPGNQIAATPNIYAFMVWEHTQDATQPGLIGTMNSEFTVQKWLQAAGIGNATLVAMNYFKAYGSVYTRAVLRSSTNPAIVGMAMTCTLNGYSADDKMCMSHSSTSTTGDTTGMTTGTTGTTTGAVTSGSTVTSLALSLMIGIALAITIALN